MNEHRAEVHAAPRNLPGLADPGPEGFTMERLGGLTNRVFRVEAPGLAGAVIVRIPGAGTEDYIDREVELHNAREAAAAGVSAEVLWADAASGVMITRAIPGIVTMTPALFRSRPGAPARAGEAFARLHNSGREFRFRFELFSMIDDYLKVLAGREVALPEGYHEVVAAAAPVREALAASPAPLAPCHCDPLCENFLDDGSRMWIVDWEYSGMNDPLWDLGDLAVEGGFDEVQEREMLTAYFGRSPSAAEAGRVVIYKAMCDLLWTLWGLIQLADGNPAEDFEAYAATRFARCRALMEGPDFAGHVAAVRAG